MTLEASDTPLVEVVKAGAPGLPIDNILPFISMFAVSNTALINMLMASRLIYGMARQHVLPPVLGTVHPRTRRPVGGHLFTTAIAFGLIIYVTAFANSKAITHARRDDVAAAACGVRRRQRRGVWCCGATCARRADISRRRRCCRSSDVITSLYLVTPLSGRPSQQYILAAILVRIGIVLFFVTMAINRQLGVRDAGITDPTHLGEAPD